MTGRRLWIAWLSLVAGLVGTAASPIRAEDLSPEGAVAAAKVPLEKIPQRLRGPMREVLDKPTLFSQGPTEVFGGQIELYSWFLDHPDKATKVWRRLGAQCVELSDLGNGHFGWCDDQGSDIRWDDPKNIYD